MKKIFLASVLALNVFGIAAASSYVSTTPVEKVGSYTDGDGDYHEVYEYSMTTCDAEDCTKTTWEVDRNHETGEMEDDTEVEHFPRWW